MNANWKRELRLLLTEMDADSDNWTTWHEAAEAVVRKNWSAVLAESSDPIGIANLFKTDPLTAMRIIAKEDDSREVGELIEIDEAAKILAVSKETVARLTKAGDIPCVKVGDRLVRYDSEAIRDFIRRGGVQ